MFEKVLHKQQYDTTFICSVLENFFFVLVGFFPNLVLWSLLIGMGLLHKMFCIIGFSVSQYSDFRSVHIQKCGVPFDSVVSPETS